MGFPISACKLVCIQTLPGLEGDKRMLCPLSLSTTKCVSAIPPQCLQSTPTTNVLFAGISDRPVIWWIFSVHLNVSFQWMWEDIFKVDLWKTEFSDTDKRLVFRLINCTDGLCILWMGLVTVQSMNHDTRPNYLDELITFPISKSTFSRTKASVNF